MVTTSVIGQDFLRLIGKIEAAKSCLIILLQQHRRACGQYIAKIVIYSIIWNTIRQYTARVLGGWDLNRSLGVRQMSSAPACSERIRRNLAIKARGA